MAKTLIGNIKGENGRGIASIKKTGTTGSVDTYTITYTDSTTSTFTINNSDSISLQRQIVPSAAVESSATASQAYAAGDYVVVNGVLRKVKSAIAKGNAISDSNSTATTVTGELANYKPVKLYDDNKGGVCWYCRTGNIVTIVCQSIQTTAMKEVRLGTLPEELRPSVRAVGVSVIPGYDSLGQLSANVSGLVAIYSIKGSGAFSATLTYPIV